MRLIFAALVLTSSISVQAENSKSAPLREIMSGLRNIEVVCPILEAFDPQSGQMVKRERPLILKLKLDGDVVTLTTDGFEDKLKVGRFNIFQYTGEHASINIDAVNDFKNKRHFSSGRSVGFFGLAGVLFEEALVSNAKKTSGDVVMRVIFNTDNQYQSTCTN